jgi:hypothetical protein
MSDTPQFTPQLVSAFRPPTHRVLAVALGAFHVLALVEKQLETPRIYSWGSNAKGQLGNGSHQDCFTPMPIVELDRITVLKIVCGEMTSAALTGMAGNGAMHRTKGCTDLGSLQISVFRMFGAPMRMGGLVLVLQLLRRFVGRK